MRACFALVALCVFAVGFAPAPFFKARRQRDDPTDVAGTWHFVLWEMSGNRHQGSEETYDVEMSREKYDFVQKNRNGGRTKYQMRLDASTSPHSFTWSMGDNVMFVGSYRLDRARDEMTMIFAPGRDLAARPTNFDDPRPPYRFVMRRVSRQ